MVKTSLVGCGILVDLNKLVSVYFTREIEMLYSSHLSDLSAQYLSVSSWRKKKMWIPSGYLLVMNSSTRILSVIATSMQLYSVSLAWFMS